MIDIFDIERCPLDYYCSKTWEELSITNTPKIKFCEKCKHEVYLCETVEEYDLKASQGICVALQLKSTRDRVVVEKPLGLPSRMQTMKK